VTLREERVTTGGEGVGHSVGEDGADFFDGVAGCFVGRRRASVILVVTYQTRDAVSVSMVFARFVLYFKVVFL
jgi:hypothetical protein